MKTREVDWVKIFTEAKNQLKKLDIDSEYVYVNEHTSSHGEKYSDALVTIRIPVRGNRKEIEILMQQNNFCKLRCMNSNGVRYLCGWLSFRIEEEN